MSSLMTKALLMIGLLGSIAGGSYLIYENLFNVISINHSEILAEHFNNKEKTFKLISKDQNEHKDLDYESFCEFFKKKEDEGEKSIKGKPCKKYMTKILGDDLNNWPLIWLRVKKDNFNKIAKTIGIIGDNFSFSNETKNWTYSFYLCSMKGERINNEAEERYVVSCEINPEKQQSLGKNK
ncbi:hypothetical protein [Mycoplasma parvum]|uniref:Uncharacterized protein n=1 Tax=Mycoplasma parvum str. Indiana TaxID=1403316 RepID=U5NC18_9MOLU|nr:hypothetical protein [Mycoplasma parvum]AGX88830.1 hypothetical protein PRV_00225 [Mycoplasma parvum str. Indiana]